MAEVAEIIIHKADQPEFIADLFDADALSSEDDGRAVLVRCRAGY